MIITWKCSWCGDKVTSDSELYTKRRGDWPGARDCYTCECHRCSIHFRGEEPFLTGDMIQIWPPKNKMNND